MNPTGLPELFTPSKTASPGPGVSVPTLGSWKYAQNLILVICLLVNFFTKMKIARHPEGFQVPGVVEMNPTGLPELF